MHQVHYTYVANTHKFITRNAVIVLYVLLECLKWISTLLSLAIVAYP